MPGLHALKALTLRCRTQLTCLNIIYVYLPLHFQHTLTCTAPNFSAYKNQATCFEVFRHGFRFQMLKKLQFKFRYLHLYHWQNPFIFGSAEPQQLPLISVRAAGSSESWKALLGKLY